MQATMADFRELAALIGVERHWRADDGKDALPVERADYWLPLIVQAHIPQLVLTRQLYNNEACDPDRYRDRVRDLLNRRALLVLALSHAVDHNQPVRWPDMNGDHNG
jgi:hypothetical protein